MLPILMIASMISFLSVKQEYGEVFAIFGPHGDALEGLLSGAVLRQRLEGRFLYDFPLFIPGKTHDIQAFEQMF